MLFCRPTNKRS